MINIGDRVEFTPGNSRHTIPAELSGEPAIVKYLDGAQALLRFEGGAVGWCSVKCCNWIPQAADYARLRRETWQAHCEWMRKSYGPHDRPPEGGRMISRPDRHRKGKSLEA